MRLVFVLLSVTTLLPPPATAAESTITISTVSGGSVSGDLKSIADMKLTVIIDEKQTQLPLGELQRVQFANKVDAVEPFAKVYLNDGSQLHCASLTITDGVAACRLQASTIPIPTRDIQYIRLTPFRPAVAEQWKNVLAAERASDQVVVRRKNDVIDYLDGVLGDMSSEHVKFEFDDEVVDVKLAKIDGMIFFQRSQPKYPRPACTITTTDGSVFASESIHISDTVISDTVKTTTLAGHEIQLPIESLSNITFTNRSSVFLSDLEPEQTVWRSAIASAASNELSQFFQPRYDKGFRNEPLSLMIDGSKREFSKGVAALSHTELTYRLASEYRSFKATIGIDASVAQRGEAKLEIWADSKKVLDRFVRSSDSAIPIDVDLSSVGRMRIVVSKGKVLGDGDYIILCDARLLK